MDKHTFEELVREEYKTRLHHNVTTTMVAYDNLVNYFASQGSLTPETKQVLLEISPFIGDSRERFEMFRKSYTTLKDFLHLSGQDKNVIGNELEVSVYVIKASFNLFMKTKEESFRRFNNTVDD